MNQHNIAHLNKALLGLHALGYTLLLAWIADWQASSPPIVIIISLAFFSFGLSPYFWMIQKKMHRQVTGSIMFILSILATWIVYLDGFILSSDSQNDILFLVMPCLIWFACFIYGMLFLIAHRFRS